jgi:hypothetical protein
MEPVAGGMSNFQTIMTKEAKNPKFECAQGAGLVI